MTLKWHTINYPAKKLELHSTNAITEYKASTLKGCITKCRHRKC